MFVNFFNTFIHQYGHRLVFISGRNHDRCLPIRGCQFVIFEKFMNDVHLHLRKAKQGVQPDAEVNDQEVNDQEYGDLKGVEQAKMEPEEVVAHDRIKNIEPEVLPMENADAMSSVRVRSLPVCIGVRSVTPDRLNGSIGLSESLHSIVVLPTL